MAIFSIFNSLIEFILSLDIIQYLYVCLSLIALFGFIRRLI